MTKRDLFIIEAPGKRLVLEELLNELSIDARVVATKGHIFHSPPSLSEPSLDSSFREINRKPRDQKRIKYLLDAAQEAKAVYIATDADQEGDVIAWDVATIISDIHPAPLRIRLRGLDARSLRAAISITCPIKKNDAVAGRARAIIDRTIGRVFSKRGAPVGRISSALLGVVAGYQPTPHQLHLVAPDKNGGRAWRASTDIKPPLTMKVAQFISELELPAISFLSQATRDRSLPNMGDIMVQAADELDLKPSETDSAMQALYEAGQISYPRAGSRGVTPFVDQYLKAMAGKSGIRTSSENAAPKQDDDVHDAPHPLVDVDVNLDINRMGRLDAVKTLIARRSVKAVAATETEQGGAAPIEEFLLKEGLSKEVAEIIANLNWSRNVGPKYPGMPNAHNSEVVSRPREAALLEKVIELGLGRPSTWSSHIEKFLSRGLVDDELKLTDAGIELMRNTPRAMLTPTFSIAIEKACEFIIPPDQRSDREPWEDLALQIVSAMPEDLKIQIAADVAKVAADKPDPSADNEHEFDIPA